MRINLKNMEKILEEYIRDLNGYYNILQFNKP
jgi:hypothetical protein